MVNYHEADNEPGVSDTPSAGPVVYVIEADEGVRASIVEMLADQGFRSREYPSAEALLAAPPNDPSACLVLDHRLSGVSGAGLQDRLRRIGQATSMVVVVGRAEGSAALQLVENGPVTLLDKPFRAEDLANAIRRATRHGESRAAAREKHATIASAVERLTTREKAILGAIVAGELNKEIASQLEVSVRTVEGDRAKILEKFAAATTGEVIGKYAQYRVLAELGLGGGPV